MLVLNSNMADSLKESHAGNISTKKKTEMKRAKVIGLKYLSLFMHTTYLIHYTHFIRTVPTDVFSSEFAKLSDIIIVYTYTLNGETWRDYVHLFV